ncbi:MAG TPA: serine/threonine-protein kinase [Gemmataceae bacterium]|nr:serine/threonine-protein kinase [Gemmataceae bacterium]
MPPASAATDCNLLFGILAVQMDFISRDALIAAMNAWVLNKAKSLGQILVEQGALGSDAHPLLEALVHKHLELHGNDPEQSLAALDPAGFVREDLRQIADAQLHATLTRLPVGSPADDPYSTRQATPASAGTRFRILRPHRKGGLGEVFVAHDEELHREVALKEIQPQYADHPESRSRFLLEAEITGGLEHPGIVPIYGLGQYADGRPFYAMRFIKGESLHDAIQRFHRAENPGHDPGERILELRNLLGRFLDVCNAIAYAHSRGVLHRDLKPGNIMLGPYGETLVVDWGLAKPVGRSDACAASEERSLRPASASGSTFTQMGSAVGTPAFMSPEQAAGQLDQLGPASDVYSLGATLYCLLTGRAPFQEPCVGLLLEQVKNGDFARPGHVQPSVPPALEAICLQAMALRPQERYATALDLAADIEHWLADEPVTAYREPWSVRTGRWMRRHRPLVAGAAALLLAAVPLSLVIAVNREQARQQAEADKHEIARQKNLAEDKEKAANQREAETKAVLKFVEDRVFAAARPEGQRGGLGYEVTLRRAVKEALPFVAKSFTDQPLVEARLRWTLGTSFWYLGDAKTAAEQFERARALYARHRGPDHPDTLTSMTGLANSYADLGRHADALKLREETLTLLKAKLGPDHPDTLTSMNNLANSYTALGRHADALKLREETLTLRKAKLGPDHPDTLRSMWGVAESLMKLERGTEAVPIIDDCVQRAAGKVIDPPLFPFVMALRLRHFEKAKDPAGCRQTAEMWEKLNRADADSLYNAACWRAVTAAVLRAADPSPAGAKQADAEAEQAMAWLKQAVAAGYKKAAHMEKDKDLDALRDREDFKKLLLELKEATEPAKP